VRDREGGAVQRRDRGARIAPSGRWAEPGRIAATRTVSKLTLTQRLYLLTQHPLGHNTATGTSLR